MLTRRQLLMAAAAAQLPSGVFAGVGDADASRASDIAHRKGGADPDLCSQVDVFIGTGGHGHTFPGATVPFGMVQLSPDTDVARWDACSGYHHDDTSIMGFSHTHLSGTGVGDMLDVLVVPRTGAERLTPGTLSRPEDGYRSRFDHASERAEPGYYRVMLSDSDVEGELTATARAGLHRYRFGGDAGGHLLVDFSHGSQESADRPTQITEATRLLENGRIEEAQAIVSRLRTSPDPPLQVLFLSGALYSIRERYGEAAEEFRLILARDPTPVRPRLELARALFMARQYAAARYHFEQVLASPLPEAVKANVLAYLTLIRERVPSFAFSFDIVSDSNPKQATSSSIVEIGGLLYQLKLSNQMLFHLLLQA